MGYLGVDIGSLFVGMVLIDEAGEVVRKEYLRHQGEPLKCVRGLLEGFSPDDIRGVARTGSGGRALPLPGTYVDPIVAGLEGARKLAPDARNILSIGGGSFSLTQLDEAGRYRRSSVNSACASGTGAFLDQQALRLQIPPAELAQCAMCYKGRPPSVATRCAVFAKSDIIHLQQEGFSVEAIAAGLCVGLGASTVDGLLDGRALVGKTLLIGGMARNSVVVGAIREKLGVEIVVPDSPELAGAYGAALVARQQDGSHPLPADWIERLGAAGDAASAGAAHDLRAPLALKLSTYPAFTWHDHWVNEDDSEVAIVAPRRGAVRVALGIDIGSTSTKATALDEQNRVVGWVYRKTAGNPIRAVQLVFKAFREMEKRGGFTLDIRGVGTTGSGRKMIKEVIGADLSMNEITAHARAAVFIDAQVDTIIELGGQDAKFTQLQNGMVYNSVMNYVCAAGTGSFIEEQALKLGIPLSEFAERAMGQPCPRTSDRCTVYMERDLDLLMARGWSKDQIAAAVLHSVRDNYLNKVVGGLHIGDHIYFQGATARNKALVAAFEVELQKPIAVSPYCHLTGSLGMSLLARERVPEAERSARFKGLAFADEKVTVDREVCDLCHNLCNLSIIRAGREVVAWGLKCGRDYGEKRMRMRDLTAYEFWKKRVAAWADGAKPAPTSGRAARPRVGLLRGLGTYEYYPFWRTFLRELGAEVVYSPPSSEKILHRGWEITTAEYCAPVVMSHGAARALLEDSGVEYLFVPHMLREPVPAGFSDAHFCCYIQAHPSVLKSIEGLNLGPRLLAPIVDLSRPEEEQAAALWRVVGEPLRADAATVRRALRAARAAQDAFRQESLALGREALARLERDNALGLVCFGRPYNTTDPGLTLDLPRKVAEMGYHVLYQDMLPFSLEDILPAHRNMYWHNGQKILAAAEYVARAPRLFGIYFTNFMCGPDSYILTYFKEIMGRSGKPYLCLQFDGHGADAGYLTRIEAALESFHSWSRIPRPEGKKVNSES